MTSPALLIVSRIVVRVAALALALVALYLLLDPLGPTTVETSDDSGLGVGLAVMLLTAMMLLGWGAAAAIWALVDGLRLGWQIAPVWLGVMAVMVGVAVPITQGLGVGWAALFTAVPIGLGLLLGASSQTVRSHAAGRGITTVPTKVEQGRSAS